MGCLKFPRIHLYWSSRFKLPVIADAIPRDRLYLLRVNLHIVDVCTVTEEIKKNNRLWRVQPMIDLVRSRCRELKRESEAAFSIDEQMIPFLGRCALRQYVKNKPRPVGLKNFVLSKSDGTVLDFEIYQGTSTNLRNKELGLGPSVNLRLVETLPVNSFVFFDRYFSTIPLLLKLSELGINGTGTIKNNRFKADPKI
uniref:PiggyBac transposable element-derived protein 3-like n=1 Tax=Diabrotica virgifera virgifera TaxID=50390 RepID=A0A6P7FTH3_DIAVI